MTREGQALVRLGVTTQVLNGTEWAEVDAPSVPLKKVEAGGGAVWGLDREGGLYRRTQTQPAFPEGKDWQFVCGGVHDMSVSAEGVLWAVMGDNSDLVVRNQCSDEWQWLPGNSWKSVCVKMLKGSPVFSGVS